MQKERKPLVTETDVKRVKKQFSPSDIDAVVHAAEKAGLPEEEKLNLLPFYIAHAERKGRKEKPKE